jgi:protein tyrosine phosphatase (PTP) superfamily phosphohydrolase (DUF442 family)
LDYTPITEQLLLGAWPRARDVPALEALGVRLLLCMQMERPDPELARPPRTLLRLAAWDTPLTFVSVDRLRQGVDAALPVLASGGRVMAYCKRGRRRSAAMVACILIAQGYSSDAAIARIKERRPVARPATWWVARRIRQFERDWLAGVGQGAGPAGGG